MARTYRRNSPQLIRRNVGTLDDIRRDFLEFPRWMRKRYPQMSPEQVYALETARYTSDAYRTYTPPRWWVNYYVHRPERRFMRREIHRCLRQGHWEDHLTDNGYYRPYY